MIDVLIESSLRTEMFLKKMFNKVFITLYSNNGKIKQEIKTTCIFRCFKFQRCLLKNLNCRRILLNNKSNYALLNIYVALDI